MTKKAIMSTQAFCPIAEVSPDGIMLIKGKDGPEYALLMQFTPINLRLISEGDRARIIEDYAKALRSFPDNVQICVISRNTDPEKYVRKLQAAMDKERDPRCKVFQRGQIDMVRSISAESVYRQFFVAIRYKRGDFGGRTPTYPEIRRYLIAKKREIANALHDCGNMLIEPDDNETPDQQTLSILYSILCRSQSESVSYEERRDAAFAEFLQTHGPNSNDLLPVTHLISPETINSRFSSSALKVDDLYYCFLYVNGNSYNTQANAGWFTLFTDIGPGVDTTFFLQRKSTAKVKSKLRILQNINESSLENVQRTNAHKYELQAKVKSGRYVEEALAGGQDCYVFGVMLTVSDSDLERLRRKVDIIETFLSRSNIEVAPLRDYQTDAFLASLPICPTLPKMMNNLMHRNAMTEGIASAYPFASPDIYDEDGIPIGKNTANDTMILLDFFAPKYGNYNGVMFGASGFGKSFLLHIISMRMREKGIPVICTIPEKGEEWIRSCKAIGGSYAQLGVDNINPLEIRPPKRSAANRLNGADANSKSLLKAKIEQVITFFSFILPNMTAQENRYLTEALMTAYRSRGITTDNASLYQPDSRILKAMPILSDVEAVLRQYAQYVPRLLDALYPFTAPDGPLSSFNQQTTVDLNNKYVVIDVSNIEEKLISLAMYIAIDYIWGKVTEDPTVHKVVIFDELWKLLGSDAPPACRAFIRRAYRISRGYGASVIGATQTVSGLFANENDAADIIGNSAFSFLLHIKAGDVKNLKRQYNLTAEEAEQVLKLGIGQALLFAGSTHVTAKIQASSTEYPYITSRPDDLKELLDEEE